ncbi:MAG: calcium-binding protein [Alphaproteobacteria bacterium]|jgi:Ca2+-binding RTX toxin-like protein|nr:calcium-binding protein [Alphaproteobacteria bacterium]
MANILKIFSNSLVQGTDDDDFITVLAGNATIEGKLGNDKIITLIGNNTIYGDLSAVTVSAVGGINTPVTGGNITATYGNDCVYAGLGNDIVVGDVGNILLRAKAGSTISALIASNANALLENVSLTMGIDTLYGGLGDDSLYGDVRTMNLESLAGTANNPTAGNQSANSRIQGVTFLGATDYLYGGSGNDVLHGDIGSLNLLAQSNDALGADDQSIAFIRAQSVPLTNVFTMGNDSLYGDNGNDTLFGDIGIISLKSLGGTVNGGISAQSQILGNTFNMGSDELHGGNEDDNIYGDVGKVALFLQGGNTSSSFSSSIAFIRFVNSSLPVLLDMGDDHLYGDNGNDKLIGDIGTVTINNTARLNSAAVVVTNFLMGNDTLESGNGDDFLWGDVTSIELIGDGGITDGNGSPFSGAITGSSFSMGIDTLKGGSGNDILYGDVGSFTYSLKSGTITSSNTDPDAEAETGSGAGPINALILNMGDDTLLSGESGNDVIYGDVGAMSLNLQAGNNFSIASTLNFAVASFISDGIFTMGNDTLDGGNGNDQLYGDLGSLSISLINGTGPGSGTAINNTILQFGNDTLIGGSGNDILVGDIANPLQLLPFLNAPLTPTPPTPTIPNQLNFGNDTFVFTLGGNNGNDIIKDMNVGATSTATTTVTNVMDTLKFTDVKNVGAPVLDYHDVDAAVSFSNSGGHLKMSFAGGSVLFENINYANQHSVLDITPNVIVV